MSGKRVGGKTRAADGSALAMITRLRDKGVGDVKTESVSPRPKDARDAALAEAVADPATAQLVEVAAEAGAEAGAGACAEAEGGENDTETLRSAMKSAARRRVRQNQKMRAKAKAMKSSGMAKAKPKAKATAPAASEGGAFQSLTRRAKINRFTRSLKVTKKKTFENGDESKAPTPVIEECKNDPVAKKAWMNKFIGKSGAWGEIWAEEKLENTNETENESGRGWMFFQEIIDKFGEKVAKSMCKELDDKQKLLPPGDITHTRQHPDMTKAGKIGKQWKILKVDDEKEKNSKKRSVSVTTKVDLKKGTPDELSRKDLPSSSSATPAPKKKLKKNTTSPQSATPANSKFSQAKTWLTKVKLDEIQCVIAEIQSKAVKARVPAGMCKEHLDLMQNHHTKLVTLRSSLEEILGRTTEKTFSKEGGNVLDEAIQTKNNSTLDIKGWKSLYNVYMNSV